MEGDTDSLTKHLNEYIKEICGKIEENKRAIKAYQDEIDEFSEERKLFEGWLSSQIQQDN